MKSGLRLVYCKFYNPKYVTGSDSDGLRAEGRESGEKNPGFPVVKIQRVQTKLAWLSLKSHIACCIQINPLILQVQKLEIAEIKEKNTMCISRVEEILNRDTKGGNIFLTTSATTCENIVLT